MELRTIRKKGSSPDCSLFTLFRYASHYLRCAISFYLSDLHTSEDGAAAWAAQNVFIFFRWIFRKLYGPVGPPAKPFGIRLDIGMVRRTLKRDIQSHFDLMAPGRLQQALKV